MSHHLLAQRHERDARHVRLLAVLRSDPAADIVGIGSGLLESHARRDPGDHRPVVRGAIRVSTHQLRRRPECGPRGIVELRRRHAHDGEHHAVERQRDTGSDGRAAQYAPPETSAHHHRRRPALTLLVGKEEAPVQRLYPHGAEEVLRDDRGVRAHRLVTAYHRDYPPVGRFRHRGEAARLFLDVLEVGIGEVAVPALRPDLRQSNESLRFRIRQRPKKYAVHHREDRGGRADPQREGEQCNDREEWRSRQSAEREAEIAHRRDSLD